MQAMDSTARAVAALGIMVVSVVLYAAYPVALYFAGFAQLSTLSYVFLSQAIASAIIILFMLGQGRLGDFLRVIFSRREAGGILIAGLIGGVLSAVSHMALYLGLQTPEKAQAAVLYETWTILFLIFTMLFRQAGQGGFLHRHDPVSTIVFFLIGFAGLVFISGSKADLGLNAITDLGSVSSASGILLGLFAAISMGVSAMFTTRNSRWITEAIRRLPGREEASSRMIGGTASSFMIHFVSMIFALVAGLAFDPAFLTSPETAPSSYIGLLAAGAIIGVAGSLWSAANNISTISNINLLNYFTPIVAVFFLFWFGLSGDLTKGFFVGVIFIVIANFALNMDTDFSAPYRFSLIALAVFSFVCVFYEGYGNDEFFGVAAIPISLYAILVAFVSNRLAQTRAQREEDAIELLQLARRRGDGPLERFVFELLGSDEIFDTRAEAQRFIKRYSGDGDAETAKKIFRLVRSKIGVNTFGETFVLWLLGTGTIAAVILGRPPASSTADLISVVISVSVVFLTFQALDIDNRKRTQMLRDMFDDASPAEGPVRLENNRTIYVDIFISWLFMLVVFALYYGAVLSAA